MSALVDVRARARREGWEEMIRTEADERALLAGCWVDLAEVARVVGVLESMVLTVGEWAGRTAQLLEWQVEEIVAPLFGWRRPDGYRRHRELQGWVAKKNTKTTLLGMIGIHLLAFDGEASARLGSFARERSQAALCWQEAVAIIQATPQLVDEFVIVPTSHIIVHPGTDSEWRVYPKGSESREGPNLSAVIVDEMHVITDPRLLPTIRYAGAARRQPVRAIISTAGEDLDSVGGREYRRAKAIERGEIQADDVLVVIHEPTEEMAPGSVEAIQAANPCLGSIVQLDEIQAAYQAALSDPDQLPDYLRYRENRWVSNRVGGLDLVSWDACPTDDVDLAGRPCFLAVDLASRRDMCALAALFPPVAPDDLVYHALVWYWLPSALLDPPPAGVKDIISVQQRERYRRWRDSGHLRVTEGASTDYAEIREFALGLRDRYRIIEVDVDRYEAAKICQELKAEGLEVVEVGQGAKSMSSPSKELRDVLLPSARLNHRGHPILRYNVESAVFVQGGGDLIRPDKRDSVGKIDGLVTVIMGLGRAMVVEIPAPKGPSRYARGEGIRGA